MQGTGIIDRTAAVAPGFIGFQNRIGNIGVSGIVAANTATIIRGIMIDPNVIHGQVCSFHIDAAALAIVIPCGDITDDPAVIQVDNFDACITISAAVIDGSAPIGRIAHQVAAVHIEDRSIFQENRTAIGGFVYNPAGTA